MELWYFPELGFYSNYLFMIPDRGRKLSQYELLVNDVKIALFIYDPR